MIKKVVFYTGLIISLLLTQLSLAQNNTDFEGLFNNQMFSLKTNNFNQFTANASSEFKAAITEKQFSDLVVQVGSHIKSGYNAEYLGKLNQFNFDVHLWKVVYSDGSDDNLVKLVLNGNEVSGFWMQ